MLSSMRKSAHSFFSKILLGLLAASFALWGIGDILQSKEEAPVAIVGEASVTETEYYRELMRLRANLGEYFTKDIIEGLNLYDVTLGALVSDKLVQQEAEFLHLQVGDALIKKVLLQDEQFHNEQGIFDREVFSRRLRQLQISEKDYLDKLQETIRYSILEETITPQGVMDAEIAKTLYEVEQQQRQVLAFVIDAKDIEVAQLPDEEVLRIYYNEHQPSYMAPEYRELRYVLLDKETVTDTIVITEESVRNAYIERQKELQTPERREVSQLLYEEKPKAEQAYGLLRSGNSIREVMQAVPPSNTDQISLGYVTKNQLPAAEDAVFALEKGGFTSPVQTEFGWHIFMVQDITQPTTPSFDSLKGQLRAELAQQRSNDMLQQMVEKMEDSIAAGMDIDAIAQALNVKVRKTPAIDRLGRRSDNTVALDPARFGELINAGFLLQREATSQVLRLSDGTYFVVQTKEIAEERQRALEEVLGQVVTDWRKQQKRETVQAFGEKIMQQVKELEDINSENLAKVLQDFDIQEYEVLRAKRSGWVEENYQVIDTGKIPASFIESVFAATQVGDVLALSDYGKEAFVGGVFLETLSMDKVANQKDYQDIIKRLNKLYEQEVSQQYINALRQRFPVTYNQPAINRVLEQF